MSVNVAPQPCPVELASSTASARQQLHFCLTHFEDVRGGVRSPSPEIAEARAKYPGDLSPSGLITLSDEATKALRSNIKAVLPDSSR